MPTSFRELILVAVIGLAISIFPNFAVAQNYSAPSDPIAPTSFAECTALYEQYQIILDQLLAEMRRISEQSSRILVSDGSRAAEPYHRRHREISDQHGRVQSQASSARLRCTEKVRAYLAQKQDTERQRQDEERGRTLAADRSSLGQLSGEILRSGLDDVKGRLQDSVTPSGVSSLRPVFDLTKGLSSLLGSKDGRDTYNSTADIAGSLNSLGNRNSLSQDLTARALEKIRGIHLDSLGQFEMAMKNFDLGMGSGPSGGQFGLGMPRSGSGGDFVSQFNTTVSEIGQPQSRLPEMDIINQLNSFKSTMQEINRQHEIQLTRLRQEDERRQAEAREQARREADARARAQREAEERRQAEIRERARLEAEARTRREADERRQAEIRERERQQAEQARLRREADARESARLEAEARARRDADARRQAEIRERERRQAEQDARLRREAEARESARRDSDDDEDDDDSDNQERARGSGQIIQQLFDSFGGARRQAETIQRERARREAEERSRQQQRRNFPPGRSVPGCERETGFGCR